VLFGFVTAYTAYPLTTLTTDSRSSHIIHVAHYVVGCRRTNFLVRRYGSILFPCIENRGEELGPANHNVRLPFAFGSNLELNWLDRFTSFITASHDF